MADWQRMAFVKDGSGAVTMLAGNGAERMLKIDAVIARRTRSMYAAWQAGGMPLAIRTRLRPPRCGKSPPPSR